MALTKNQIRNLSSRLKDSNYNPTSDDIQQLHELRMAYRDFLSFVFRTLSEEADKIDSKAICTYRIKRVESIISKLRRFPNTSLVTMEDLAGCRCILLSRHDIPRLVDSIKRRLNVTRTRDYITNTPDTGYKSYHLTIQDDNNSQLKLEIQLRSRVHHNWATLVEITDQVLGTKIKENHDIPDLMEFHRLFSKSESEVTIQDKKRLLEIADNYDYVSRIGQLFIQNNQQMHSLYNEINSTKDTFFLVETDNRKLITFLHFTDFRNAEEAYIKQYAELSQNGNSSSNLLLFHVQQPDFNTISMAYSNYFLTYNELFYRLISYRKDLVIRDFDTYLPYPFVKTAIKLLYLTQTIAGNFANEVIQFSLSKPSMLKATTEEWEQSLQKQLMKLADAYITINSHIKQSKYNILNRFIWKITRGIFKHNIIKRNRTTHETEITIIE
ncbi:MAG: RelA/SpoT domain-containing protein [Barnesiella sp.]|nr:RelA/SpoT domain-containing protein [Barnesiella sp.]